MTISRTFRRLGTSYMMSSIAFSRMARRPRAPALFFMAARAMATSAPSVNLRVTPSISSSFLYCFTSALRGRVRMSTSAGWSSSSRLVMTGRRPTNSGIIPNLSRSSGSTMASSSPTFFSVFDFTSVPKPRLRPPERRSMICSSPQNAPPQMNRMLVVSTCRNSCCGCFRPPFGGTFATVPSMILSSACCTPSPDTSRVIDGFSLLRAILSISSM
jgi:hypothetical protein